MRVYGFRCKTPGCEAFLVMGELAEDTARAVQVPINLGDDRSVLPLRLLRLSHLRPSCPLSLRNFTTCGSGQSVPLAVWGRRRV